jgi:hypothetical protein
MKTCKYSSCGKEIPLLKHGNRDYCDDLCYYFAKLERNYIIYTNNSQKLNEINRIESILRTLHDRYGSEKYIEGSILEELAMRWNLFNYESKIDGFPVNVIGEYAYCCFANKTVRIWKI